MIIFLLTLAFIYGLDIVLAKVYSRPQRFFIASAILAVVFLLILPIFGK